MTDEMKQLHEAVTRVKALLDDPHEGLITWHQALARASAKTQAALSALGVTPDACGIDESSNASWTKDKPTQQGL